MIRFNTPGSEVYSLLGPIHLLIESTVKDEYRHWHGTPNRDPLARLKSQNRSLIRVQGVDYALLTSSLPAQVTSQCGGPLRSSEYISLRQNPP